MFKRSDNGGEFVEEAFKQQCAECGIRQEEETPPGTPKLNGVVERELGKVSFSKRLRDRCLS